MIVQNASEHGVTDISFTVPHERPRRRPMRVIDDLSTELGATGVGRPTTTSPGSRSSAPG